MTPFPHGLPLPRSVAADVVLLIVLVCLVVSVWIAARPIGGKE